MPETVPCSAEASTSTTATPRPWLQFSLLTLLLVVTLASLPLGWWAYVRQHAAAVRHLHGLIRESARGTQPVAVGQDWEVAREALQKSGYVELPADNGKGRWLVRRNIWTGTNGVGHDVIVDLWGGANLVTEVEVCLVATPNLPYTQTTLGQMYPAGSILDRCLAEPSVAERAEKFPILKEVKVTYGAILDKWSPEVMQGFHITVELGASAQNDDAGSRLYFTVDSLLDPPTDWRGKASGERFVRSEELGELRSWGGSSWERLPDSSP